MRNENFASEIFGHKPEVYVALQKTFTKLCGPASKQRRTKRFRVPSLNPDAAFGSTSPGVFRTTNVRDVAGFRKPEPQPNWISPNAAVFL
jgi:hypothetical protein